MLGARAARPRAHRGALRGGVRATVRRAARGLARGPRARDPGLRGLLRLARARAAGAHAGDRDRARSARSRAVRRPVAACARPGHAGSARRFCRRNDRCGGVREDPARPGGEARYQGWRSGILEVRPQAPRNGRPRRRRFSHGLPGSRRRHGSPKMIMSEQGKNLDLLMNVPLKVTAELGTCKMLVRDILKLGTGSIVELDRLAGGPVDLLVNDRLVARGEVVAIDENFGVRITELIEKP